MYKKMNRVIEKEKGGSLLLQGIRFFLATDNDALCKHEMNTLCNQNTFHYLYS